MSQQQSPRPAWMNGQQPSPKAANSQSDQESSKSSATSRRSPLAVMGLIGLTTGGAIATVEGVKAATPYIQQGNAYVGQGIDVAKTATSNALNDYIVTPFNNTYGNNGVLHNEVAKPVAHAFQSGGELEGVFGKDGVLHNEVGKPVANVFEEDGVLHNEVIKPVAHAFQSGGELEGVFGKDGTLHNEVAKPLESVFGEDGTLHKAGESAIDAIADIPIEAVIAGGVGLGVLLLVAALKYGSDKYNEYKSGKAQQAEQKTAQKPELHEHQAKSPDEVREQGTKAPPAKKPEEVELQTLTDKRSGLEGTEAVRKGQSAKTFDEENQGLGNVSDDDISSLAPQSQPAITNNPTAAQQEVQQAAASPSEDRGLGGPATNPPEPLADTRIDTEVSDNDIAGLAANSQAESTTVVPQQDSPAPVASLTPATKDQRDAARAARFEARQQDWARRVEQRHEAGSDYEPQPRLGS